MHLNKRLSQQGQPLNAAVNLCALLHFHFAVQPRWPFHLSSACNRQPPASKNEEEKEKKTQHVFIVQFPISRSTLFIKSLQDTRNSNRKSLGSFAKLNCSPFPVTRRTGNELNQSTPTRTKKRGFRNVPVGGGRALGTNWSTQDVNGRERADQSTPAMYQTGEQISDWMCPERKYLSRSTMDLDGQKPSAFAQVKCQFINCCISWPPPSALL